MEIIFKTSLFSSSKSLLFTPKTSLFSSSKSLLFTPLFSLSLLLIFLLFSSRLWDLQNLDAVSFSAPTVTDRCTGRHVYMYDLPNKFNLGILRDCNKLFPWKDMCPFISNVGLGPQLTNVESVLTESGWHVTSPWVLEVIFHNRMKQYDCLTTNSTEANVFFVPYYVGLDTGRLLWENNVTKRDYLLNELFKYLRSRPEWEVHGGKDHFILSGRATWDLRRNSDEGNQWGGKLLTLPEVKNMTVLLIESCPSEGENEFAIPYPTNFHPSSEIQVMAWQDKVRSTRRSWLFSFAGARRPGQSSSIRDQVSDQCLKSTRCNILDCASPENDCDSPTSTMSLFQNSLFCLQPPGDTPTRRSAFDSMLAGCIPVFFNPHSAYTQYKWYLPTNYTEYSVYISESDVREGKVNIEEVLLRYSEDQVRNMKNMVINMIPKLIYKDPRYKLENVRDAFDVAIDGVIERVNIKIRE